VKTHAAVDQPDDGHFLTIPAAARWLRISRNAAYLAAKRYRTTDGAEGLPHIRIGGTLRVPRAALERMTRISVPGGSSA